MNILIKSLSHNSEGRPDYWTKFVHDPPQILVVLLSATCIGNDGRSNCPLFHGSLAPMIFGKTSDDNMRHLLLKSNNITWVQTAGLNTKEFQQEMFDALSKTRYSSKSLKALQLDMSPEETRRNSFSFLASPSRQVYDAIETLDIFGEYNDFPVLEELGAISALTNSVSRLICRFMTILDFPQIQQFKRLRELQLHFARISDEHLGSLSSLKDLRRLELCDLSQCTGSFLDVVCPSLPYLRSIDIRDCWEITRVSGLKHLSNSLEELWLENVRNIDGYEEWVEFPLLKTLTLREVRLRENQETGQLSSSAFPILNEIDISFQNNTFFAKILEASSTQPTAIKRITVKDGMAKEFAEALLMVPVEELSIQYTSFFESISSEVPWSDDKTITKTLRRFSQLEHIHSISSISFLANCKQLEYLSLVQVSPNIEISLSGLTNFSNLNELIVALPLKDDLLQIRSLFQSPETNQATIVVPSLQIFSLLVHEECSEYFSFEGLENIFPNLKIFVLSKNLDIFPEDSDIVKSFLCAVRNFSKLEEIRFNDSDSFNSRTSRLLKTENPDFIIYYPKTFKYEP
jgi:hypothetical protein